MATKPIDKPALTLDEELEILSEGEEKAANFEVKSGSATVKNLIGRTIYLESGMLIGGGEGIATRTEIQNLAEYIREI
jgi:hypothetical protein